MQVSSQNVLDSVHHLSRDNTSYLSLIPRDLIIHYIVPYTKDSMLPSQLDNSVTYYLANAKPQSNLGVVPRMLSWIKKKPVDNEVSNLSYGYVDNLARDVIYVSNQIKSSNIPHIGRSLESWYRGTGRRKEFIVAVKNSTHYYECMKYVEYQFSILKNLKQVHQSTAPRLLISSDQMNYFNTFDTPLASKLDVFLRPDLIHLLELLFETAYGLNNSGERIVPMPVENNFGHYLSAWLAQHNPKKT